MHYQIRHLEPGDAAEIQEIASQASVIAGTLHEPYQPAAFFENRREMSEGSRRFVALAENKVVGTGTLSVVTRVRRRHVGQAGMMVHEDWQGKGVGSALMQAIVDQADNWLNLKRIELEVFTDNVGGIKLYEKFGFEIEGTLRSFAFRDGQYINAYVMGRIR